VSGIEASERDAMPVKYLRSLAKEAGIRGYSDMNKTGLLNALAAKEREDNPLLVLNPAPTLKEVSVSYSYALKANLGQGTYESADVHISRSERFDVTGMTQEQADWLWNERYEALKGQVDPLVEAEYAQLSCFALNTEETSDNDD